MGDSRKLMFNRLGRTIQQITNDIVELELDVDFKEIMSKTSVSDLRRAENALEKVRMELENKFVVAYGQENILELYSKGKK